MGQLMQAFDVVSRPRNGLSLCAGGGGLDLGLMLAEPDFHTRCLVEWDAYPRSALIAAQRAGYFAPAPIWDDLTTFDAKPFAGAIDTVLAGYPCQPFSMAGQRRGEDDERHLWPDVARIIGELGPHLEWVFLENVAGHLSLGGETVLRELWDMGFTPSVGTFSAAETGAAHERQRWFCVAHRPCGGQRKQRHEAQPGCCGYVDCGNSNLAHTDGGHACTERQCDGGQLGFQPEGRSDGCRPMEDARCAERRACVESGHIGNGAQTGRHQGASRTEQSGQHVDHAAGARCDGAWIWAEADRQGGECVSGDGRAELADTPGADGKRHGRQPARGCGPANGGGYLADPCGARPQGRERDGSPDQRHGQAAHGPIAERGRPWLFPPGPGDAAGWAAILSVAPHLAPSLSLSDVRRAADHFAKMVARGELAEEEAQSIVRLSLDGMANRTRCLRLLGNGVHPITAAYAWRSLSAGHGLQPASAGDRR